MSTDQTTGVVIDTANQRAPLTATPDQLMQMLKTIEKDILPKTEIEVANGNKVFGAGILDKDFQCIFADTNTETTCPIFHGEVKTIFAWSQQTPAKDRGPIAQSSIFLSTHEPCCIPHDIATMHELWGVNSYRKQTKYMSTGCIMDMIAALPEGDTKKELLDLQNKLLEDYDKLANKYHSEKAANENNSLVLG
ncbi:deoxycytidylate deaminase [Nitzschia inconspicua]|uniref:Deoxycytidylate deaminase n=1 Tax=Nitzschia inconspicua TaxID=303405 RepID=A0A9K3KGP9_9STRA|nr:deoxycytidylate deaminase [Nitzschia inconspicua]